MSEVTRIRRPWLTRKVQRTAEGQWVQDREFGQAEMLNSTAPTTKEESY